MKKLITIIAISIFALASIFAAQLRVGGAATTKGTMQTSSFIQNEYYKDLAESDNYLRHNDLELYGPVTAYHLQFRDESEGIGFGYKISTEASVSNPTATDFTVFKTRTRFGYQGSTLGVFAVYNNESYIQRNSDYESFTEVGGQLELQSRVSGHFSVITNVSAFIYPKFEMQGVGQAFTNFRESSFSTSFYAEARFRSKYFSAFVGAGLKSWQYMEAESITDLVGGFVPFQIRNTFTAGIEVDLEKVKLFANYEYFCDHPETVWETRISDYAKKGVVFNFTNNVFEYITVGLSFEI